MLEGSLLSNCMTEPCSGAPPTEHGLGESTHGVKKMDCDPPARWLSSNSYALEGTPESLNMEMEGRARGRSEDNSFSPVYIEIVTGLAAVVGRDWVARKRGWVASARARSRGGGYLAKGQ